MARDIRAVRRIARGIGYFWQVMTYAILLFITVSVFWRQPSLFTQPRGWLLLALSLLFGVGYTLGYRFMVGRNNDAYWRARMDGSEYPRRGILFWATLLLLALLLSALEPAYVYLLWVPFGVSLSVMSMPRGLMLVVPTSLILFAAFGWLPHSASTVDILAFVGGCFGFGIYTAILYLPFVLIKERFARERMFMDLEQSHRALEEVHQQLADSAERDRELAVLRERGRLARDLHDTLGHSLVLVNVKLEAARRLREVDPDRADHEIAMTQEIVRTTMGELREAIANLREPLLAREALSQALARRARDAGMRAGWHVTYDVSADLGELDGETYEALLRVGTEALANAERHAHAHSVTLHMARDGCEIVLRVMDDGIGILSSTAAQGRAATSDSHVTSTDVAGRQADERGKGGSTSIATLAHSASVEHSATISSPTGHYGITGMRERVTTLGGRFTIGPGPDGSGTCVEARIPNHAL